MSEQSLLTRLSMLESRIVLIENEIKFRSNTSEERPSHSWPSPPAGVKGKVP